MASLHDLRLLAHQEGFVAVGVAPAVPAPSREMLVRWLDAGMHGSMDWMAQTAHLRTHPEAILPGARTALVFLAPYAPQKGGRIAHYARYQDYHRVLHRRLRRVWFSWIENAGIAARARFFVDSGPLMERDYATLAGLGFIGKNTMLIHPEWGSYVLIGAILTDLEVPLSARSRWWHLNRVAWKGHDPGLTEHPERLFTLCGSCTRCLDACPTGALREPGLLDARLCISYQTIENRKNPVPENLRDHLAGYLFGCDICQDVCPWNQNILSGAIRVASPLRLKIPEVPSLEEASTMDEETFRTRFAGTPLGRIRAEIFRRNAALAWLDHVRRVPEDRQHALTFLRSRLSAEPSPLVQDHLAWAVRKMERL